MNYPGAFAANAFDNIMSSIASFFGLSETRNRWYNDVLKWATGEDYSTKSLDKLVDKIAKHYDLSNSDTEKLYNKLLSVSGLKGKGSAAYKKAVEKLESKVNSQYEKAKDRTSRISRVLEKANDLNYKYTNMAPTYKAIWGQEMADKLNKLSKGVETNV